MLRKNHLNKLWQLGLAVFITSGITFNPNDTWAQLIPDETLGEENSVVTEFNELIDLIEGGAIRDTNLFHSFLEFNVDAGRGVYFANPEGILNILTRVTGGNPSNIFGTLGVDGAANLFLMNPNGIVFGESGSLDVNGSFVGTTADAIAFGEQGFFSAINPEVPGVLTVNPSALFFNQIGAGNIDALSNSPSSPGSSILGLRVGNEQNLTLVGGNVNIDGGQLNAFGGRVDIGAVVGIGAIGLNADGRLDFPTEIERADVTFNNGAVVDVRFDDGGDIAVTAQNINLLNGSELLAGIFSGVGFPESQGGNISIDAQEAIQINQSTIRNALFSGATGNTGDLIISAKSLSLSNDSLLTASTFGNGNAGSITINVQENASIEGSIIRNLVFPDATGEVNGMFIQAGNFLVTNGSQLQSSTFGEGNAGDINIEADSVSFDQFSAVFTSVAAGAIGSGGNIQINSNSLSLDNGSFFNTNTFGEGDAGSINIQAGNVFFDQVSSIFANVAVGANGNGGNIEINSNSLSLDNESVLSNSTSGEGNAGKITINSNSVSFDQASAAFSDVGRRNLAVEANGDAGGIEITADTLFVNNSSGLQSATLGEGNSGNIIINVSERVSLENNSFALTNAEAGQGDAGDIQIRTRELSVSNGSLLGAGTRTQGNAGDILIEASDRVTFSGAGDSLTGGAFTSGEFEAIGNSGDIRIITGTLVVEDGAQLAAGNREQGNAGNIIIEARDEVFFDGSDTSVFTTLEETESVGQGGDIHITTGSLFITNGAQLVSSTNGQGDAGNIIIEAFDEVAFEGINDEGSRPSSATSGVLSTGIGEGGDIHVITRFLSLTDGGRLFASTRNQGSAGQIVVDAQTILIDGVNNNNISGIFASPEPDSDGGGGIIFIDTEDLVLNNGGTISAESQGIAQAGSINIVAKDILSIDSNITTLSEQSSGGAINITAQNMLLRGDSDITTNVNSGAGGGGNITLNADSILAFDDSDIFAFAQDGIGGDIILDTPAFFGENFTLDSLTEDPSNNNLEGNNRVDINATGAVSGIVSIPDVSFIQNSLSDFQINAIDTETILANSCINRTGEAEGNFNITGRGNLPLRPGDASTLGFPTGTIRTIPSETSAARRWQMGDPIVEPQGVYQLPNGKLVLSRECN